MKSARGSNRRIAAAGKEILSAAHFQKQPRRSPGRTVFISLGKTEGAYPTVGNRYLGKSFAKLRAREGQMTASE